MWIWLLISCNTAPLGYQSTESVGTAPWDYPTDIACERRDGPSEEIDGFLYCAWNNNILPIDDPVYADCGETGLEPDTEVFWAFDGLVARAYPTALLQGRELVHDEWNEIPVLVDW